MREQRLEPLGASDDDSPQRECPRCARLQDERETLQTSLFALTSHLAQVQFRLRQVCDAPSEDREDLLAALEEFARCDVNLPQVDDDDDDVAELVRRRRRRQRALLATLRAQVERLKEAAKEPERRRVAERRPEPEAAPEGKSLRRCVAEGFASLAAGVFRAVRPQVEHWGDLRASLELAVIKLTQLLRANEAPKGITLAVRKSLATSIRDLVQHGGQAHCWEVILYYYRSRRGDEFNASPPQRLSRSFSVAIAGVSPERNKKNLLCTVDRIVDCYARYKRSDDSHFKAFVCAALNARRLSAWLGAIFGCGDVIRTFYHRWSYVATDKCRDGLRSLEVLNGYKFELPVDLDVWKFQLEDGVFCYQ